MADLFKESTIFILPLGFGCKRIEFFENQIRKLGGNVTKNSSDVTHVVIEDSVSSSKDSCLLALKTNGFELRKDVSYVKAQWLSKCLRSKVPVDVTPFLVDWVREEFKNCGEGSGDEEEEGEPVGEKKLEVESGDESLSAGKRRKVDEKMFICSRPSSSNDVGHSDRKKLVVDELEKLAEAYKVRNDTWRSYSYRKAANAILVHDKDISTYQEACQIPGLGEKMASKVMEIIESGKLSKVEEIVDEKTRTLQEFCQIWGVGPSTAEGWYVQGFRTLEDLKERAKLTKQQEIGVRLYEDLRKRIPRQEVLEIAEIVKNEVRKISSSLSVELVGSYRRGKESCGDIDLMIVNPGPKTPFEILVQVTATLRTQGYLTDDLVTLDDNDSEKSGEGIHHKKYLGVFKLPGVDTTHRRIDLFVVPKSEYAPALVHYTGSAMFNRSMKLLAAKKEMSLTEHGLYAGTVRKGSEVINKGVLVVTPTEEDIFKEVGLPYRHPEERDH